MNKVTYEIPNISCGHCVNTIETELKDMKGIIDVKADIPTRSVSIEYQDPADESSILNLLEEINYPVLTA